MRINGIGTTFLGISEQDKNGIATASNWFTFIFLPIFPTSRVRISFHEHIGDGYSYEIISYEKLVLNEILKTYLYGWILFPVMIFGGAILTVKEVWQTVGLPEIIHIPFGIVAFIWVFVSIWKLQDWHEAKCRPKKNKN